MGKWDGNQEKFMLVSAFHFPKREDSHSHMTMSQFSLLASFLVQVPQPNRMCCK